MSNTILVPTDFTPVADCAFEHAIGLAKLMEAEIALLHVVAKEKDKESATRKIDDMIAGASGLDGVSVQNMVSVGNIFDDIGGIAGAIQARLIIMGTHGAKGLQKITGSYALKVITNSEVPFVVVQKRGFREGYKKIVMPLDLTKESVQQLKLAVELGKYFRSAVHIFAAQNPDSHLRNKIKNNVIFAKKYLDKEGIAYGVKVAEGKKAFNKEVVEYSLSIDADMISIVNLQGSGLQLFGGFEQHIIANNSEIPALILNPRSTGVIGNIMLS